jgi:NADH-quinone oxidoreductase subunit N
MATAMIGLTGLPPTAGFVGKFFLLREVFAHGGASPLFFWGGVIALLNTVISLGYYARFLKAMYLCDVERLPSGPFRVERMDKLLVVALTVPILVFGLVFSGLWDRASELAKGIFVAIGGVR